MKSIKVLIFFAIAFAFQLSYSQGCEGPGEGDGIKFFGFIQPQYEYNLTGMNGERTPDNDTSGFFFNRARLGVMGNIPYDFSYYFILEYAPAGGFGVCDAYVSYDRYKPFLTAAVGQFKTPFGAEQLQGCHKLYTIDRSIASSNIGDPIRDMGIMVSGGSGSKIKISEGVENVISYQLAWMNGMGRDLFNREESLARLPEKHKTIAGRLVFTPSKLFQLGGSIKYGKYEPSSDVVEFDSRTRLGIDSKINYKNFTLVGEYLWGKDDGTITRIEGDGCGAVTITEPGSDEKDGFYLTALYKIKDKFEPVVKFESFDTSLSTDDDKVMRWTAGFNYHFNEWTRLQINYQYNSKETEYEWNSAYQDVLQIQLQAIIK